MTKLTKLTKEQQITTANNRTAGRMRYVSSVLMSGLAISHALGWAPNTSWQWQLSGDIYKGIDAAMYDVDLFEVSNETMADLRAQGKILICYYSGGSAEEYRNDVSAIDEDCIGKKLDGWGDERWLDYRCSSVLEVMQARLDLARDKRCDGVEPDNMDGFQQNTGFALSYDDQIQYNIWTANESHTRGLLVGLKNDVEQLSDLHQYFDFAVNEQCHQYNECDIYHLMTDNNKPVFNCEYKVKSQSELASLCAEANAKSLSTIVKNMDLDVPLCSCQETSIDYECQSVLNSASSIYMSMKLHGIAIVLSVVMAAVF